MPACSPAPLSVEPEFCVVARWNLSLRPRQRWQVFGSLALVSLAFAGTFAALGAWFVLPYSAVELAALAAAFALVERRAAEWERLTVAGDRVIVERGRRGSLETREWNRRWLRVEWSERRFGSPARLTLCCGRERWAFGTLLPDREKDAVARNLKRLTGAR